ncbi:Putative MOB kinase activator family [Septoria linicola]|uniref:MOB kinase activator family n=1 Tax=Septoria linicola TaxID=215465 RepID=A0A9Q9EEH1_9PEZI|nr:putative MOB kinase activator family [Septoria linicola]USW47865.1 Putative MOB kinase activator family [Septoria linicola]
MSSWMNNLRNLGRQANPTRSSPNQQPSRTNTSSPSANSPSSLYPPSLPQAQTPTSPSGQTANMSVSDQPQQVAQGGRKPPMFFREDYVGFIVKGNFMTLAAKPTLVEEGEWLAHQVVEQNRLLSGMVKIVQTEDRSNGTGLCNDKTCPTMSAGGTTYTWIDTNRNPINLPAATYIKHIQTWVAGKIQDETVFPTGTFQQAPPLPLPQQVGNDPHHWLGKSSGFPQRFEVELKNMYKQMFRCYAHLYWSHWLQFWDLNAYRDLNTCFMHFVNVGRIFGLLSERDTEPMQPLIDLWVRRGDLPSQHKEGEGKGAAGEAPKTSAAAAGPAAPAPVV